MYNNYGEMIINARNADIGRFVRDNHPGEVVREGATWMRLKKDRSVILQTGSCWYHNKSTDEYGNAIDFCMKYLGYTFKQAVEGLQPYAGNLAQGGEDGFFSKHDVNATFALPVEVKEKLSIAFKYLSETRRLPSNFIAELYLDCPAPFYVDGYENIVFPSMARDFAEIRGTRGDFHGVARGSAPDGYFCTVAPDKTDTILVTESAIDALSVHYLYGYAAASMAGLKDQTLKRIQNDYKTVVLSTDNDEAGINFDKKHPELRTFKAGSNFKDWNEELKRRLK